MASGDSSDVDFDIDWSILADSMDPHFLDLSHLKLDSVYAGVFGSQWKTSSRWERQKITGGHTMTLIPPDGRTINHYLPSELMREIFLYSIHSNNMDSGHLASVCCYWRSVVTTMPHLWSTLRVGTWTGKERVSIWLQRAYPKKVVINTQRDDQSSSDTFPLAALQDALASTGQWHELTISSFPPENLASLLGFQGVGPMNVLRALHVVAGCVHSPSFTRLLHLVPTGAPLSELRLRPSFASAHFLQPHWFPALQNLTVLIVNGRDIHEPFDLLPAFTRLQTFEADHLPLPWYGLDTNLPLLCTLRKLHLRATSVQWMAGRQFTCLEECEILVPHHWRAVQEHEVELPSCEKLTYHGYPMTTVRYFHVPKVKEMELRSHDCKKQRVYQQLRHLCTMDGKLSKLATLHLTLQCSEQVLIKVLKYLGFLQEFVLSTSHPSPSWQYFLEPLAAKPFRDDWPDWSLVSNHQKWEHWCSSQIWHANILPHLKYLGIRCPNGLSRSEYLDNGLWFRLLGWTRAQMTPPLEHLIVWEGRSNTVVDYISNGYPAKHPGMSRQEYDSMIVRGMVTQQLVIHSSTTPLFQLHSTVLFRQLLHLVVDCNQHRDHKIPIFPYLEQIKRLEIWDGIIPAYSLNIDLPLIHTLQMLNLRCSTFFWMLGRTFRALRELHIDDLPDASQSESRLDGLQVDLPGCTILKLWNFSANHLHFLCCPNVQILQWEQSPALAAIDTAALKSPQSFLRTCSRLQKLDILITLHMGRDSLIQFVFCDALGQGVWLDIRSVEAEVSFKGFSSKDRHHFFNQVVENQHQYTQWWKEFTVSMNTIRVSVIVRASM